MRKSQKRRRCSQMATPPDRLPPCGAGHLIAWSWSVRPSWRSPEASSCTCSAPSPPPARQRGIAGPTAPAGRLGGNSVRCRCRSGRVPWRPWAVWGGGGGVLELAEGRSFHRVCRISRSSPAAVAGTPLAHRARYDAFHHILQYLGFGHRFVCKGWLRHPGSLLPHCCWRGNAHLRGDRAALRRRVMRRRGRRAADLQPPVQS